MLNTFTNPTFVDLLATAVSQPGRLNEAYTRFYNYSIGNQLLAWAQCVDRGVAVGPMATYPAWQALGRQVRKGEKAIALVQPVTLRRKVTNEAGVDEDATFTRFTCRPKWFVLSQTDGADYVAPAPPEWNKGLALEALDVTEIAFDLMNGNIQGYARGRSVCVSPVAAEPFQTLVHELAHVVMGHTTEHEMQDGDDRTPRDIREVEAESVALLVLGALNQPGLEECRGYIQHWMGEKREISERSAQRIFKAADAILRAGRAAETESEAVAA